MNTQPPLAQVSVSDGEISMEPLTLNAGVSGLYSAYRMFLLFFFFLAPTKIYSAEDK